jgi:hypothetical protein
MEVTAIKPCHPVKSGSPNAECEVSNYSNEVYKPLASVFQTQFWKQNKSFWHKKEFNIIMIAFNSRLESD